jgi:putative membrane protein
MTHSVDSLLALIRATLTLMSAILLVIGAIFVVIASVLHVGIFWLESVQWRKPATWKRFGLKSQEDADVVRPMALNQGFYNLFLAIGGFVGFGFILEGPHRDVGFGIALVAVGSMLLAALVLILTQPRLWRAAVTQGLTPLVATAALILSLLLK